MKIVIEISEDEYNIAKYGQCGNINVDIVRKSLANGTPLPEHHGRIIDESQIRHIVCHTERELYGDKIRYVKTTDAPTIIEGSDTE
jgi:hypothetical protein